MTQPNTNDNNGNGRAYHASLRETVAELEGLRELVIAKLQALGDVIQERDRLYGSQFAAQKDAVAAALVAQQLATQAAFAAQQLATAAAFAASKEAIVKAEAAQSAYNIRSDEFREALSIAAKTNLPRLEADQRFGQLRELLDGAVASLAREVSGLRETRSEMLGKTAGSSSLLFMILSVGGFVVSLTMVIIVLLSQFVGK